MTMASTTESTAGADAARERAEVRRLLDESQRIARLQNVYQVAAGVAESQPQSTEAQHLAGEAAYRLSMWNEAIVFFRRGGLPDESHPTVAFYMAVSLFEADEGAEAAMILGTALPNLQRTPFVERYVAKILGDGASR